MKKNQRQELQPKQWFRIILGEKAIAEGAIKLVLDAFEQVMPAGDDSKICALFMREEGNATVVFISPRFATIAPQVLKALSAIEGEAPPPRRAGDESGTALLLASHSAAWSMLG